MHVIEFEHEHPWISIVSCPDPTHKRHETRISMGFFGNA